MQYCDIINGVARANVAQLFRALPCQGRGRELESLHSHHIMRLQMSLFCWLTLGLTLRESIVSSFAPFLLIICYNGYIKF